MSAPNANADVVKGLGLTPAPDSGTLPVVPAVPPVVDPAAPSVVAPAAPGVPAMPKELMPKIEFPAAPPPAGGVDKSFDYNAIKIEEVPEPVRPNFAKMRDLLNGQKKDIETVAKDRDALKARLDSGEVADPETLKAFKEKNTELLDKLGKLNLEADPRFVAKYDIMRKPIVDSVETMLTSYNVEGMDVKKVVAVAASLGTQERMTFLAAQLPEEIKVAATSMILPALSQLDIVEGSRQAELTQHESVSAGLKESQEAVDQLSIAALRDTAKAAAMKELEVTEPLLRRVEGNEEWNKTVDGVNAKIEALFVANDPATHAKALIESQVAPIYKHMFFAERQARETLENALRERNIVLPGIGERAPASGAEAPPVGGVTAESAAAASAGKLFG